MMEVNEQTILETIRLLKQKPTIWEQFRKWIPSILSLVTLFIILTSYFNQASKERDEIRKDVESLKSIIWLKVPGADDYMDNPFTTRSVKIGLYGSSMYCDLAYE